MDRATCTAIERDMIEALKPIAAKYGLEPVSNGGKYSLDRYTPNLSFVTKDESGALNTAEFAALKRRYPSIAGKSFYVPGKGYVSPIGYRPRATKYPVLAKYPDGKVYAIPESYVANWFTPEREAAA